MAARLVSLTVSLDLYNLQQSWTPLTHKISPDTVYINLAQPEQNAGFTVRQVSNLEANGILFNGIEIEIRGDLYCYSEDLYNAKTVDHHMVWVEQPSTPLYMTNYHDKHMQSWNELKHYSSQAHMANEMHRNDLENNPARQVRRTLLVFPEHIYLNPTPFSTKSPDGELDCYDITDEYERIIDKRTFNFTDTTIHWYIALHEDNYRKVRSKTYKKKGAAELESRFASMSM
jgi:hypothetical protein